jgi:HEAT repeat protein
MDFSVTFARHFARLIWLIRSQPDLVDDQKGALRAVVTVAKEGAVVLRADDGRLLANGTPLPEILTGVKEVAAALTGAVSYALNFEQGAPPADILGVARLIATDSPDPLVRRVAQLALRGVKMESVSDDATPARSRATAQLTSELIDQIAADQASTAAALAARAAAPAEAGREGLTGSDVIDRLIDRLTVTDEVKGATLLLEELAGRIDVCAREGKFVLVLRSIAALIAREIAITDADMRRAYLVTMRRMFRPQVLRVVMPANQHEPEIRALLAGVLQHAEEDGATIVFEEIQRARTLAERAELVRLLQALPASQGVLTKLLGDAQWHVVRTAVDLIGEIAPADAERAIADVLRHPDDRVRRTAAAAISRFDTPFAVDALYRALSDPSAQVRLQAVHGLAIRLGNTKAASVLVNAVDDEPEVEVQLAEIAALGKFATSDAVVKLTRAAEPDGRLFRRKNPAYRVAAIQALADARTPAAMAALQTLLSDRDREVREAAARVMAKPAPQSARAAEAASR